MKLPVTFAGFGNAALHAAAALLASLFLLSCTGAGGEQSAAAATPGNWARFPHGAASSGCFFQQRIDNFEVLNEANLLVFEGRRQAYHVEISPPSIDLRHAYGIQFKSSTGRVCGNPGERLALRNGSLSRLPLSVTGVYRLDEATEAAVRAHFGQSVALPPPPGNGDAEAIEELITDLEGAAGGADEDSSPGGDPGEGQEN